MGRRRTIDDDKLLEAAREVFREHGHSATTRDVASAAGISQAVLYQRFRTKDELFFAALMPAPPDIEALLGDEDEAQRGVERHLSGIALRLLVYFGSIAPSVLHLATHPSFNKQAMAQAHKHLQAGRLVESLAERIGTLQRRRLAASVDARATAEALIAAVHNVAIFRAFSGTALDATDEERVRSFVRVFWRGLMPRTDKSR